MNFLNLQSYLSFLESKKDLVRIKTEVDPNLEITEIATRVVKQKGPALLFENVKGSAFHLVINIFGTEQRMAWALGQTPAEIGAKLAEFAKDVMPPTLGGLWRQRAMVKRVLAMKPKSVRQAPVSMNCIEPANLDLLPIAQSWPQDGGPFMTFPSVITKSPSEGKQNVAIYRMQKFSPTETGMHWQIAKGGGYHYQQAEQKEEPLPVAVVFGADPLLMFSGVLPLPENIDEMAFAGFLRNHSTPTWNLKESNLNVPAEAEFILEGFVPPHQRRREGPYGDHFGHYSQAADFPVFNVNRIWHRDHPIYPIAVVGKPPQEDQVMGDAVQEIMLPLLKIMHPEIVDMWAYQEAGFHNLLVISVKQRFEKEAIKTGLWALGEGQLALTKCVILVDSSVNPRRFDHVLKAVGENFDPQNDFVLLPATSQDTLDFTGPKMNLGSKMILDATIGKTKNTAAPAILNEARIKDVDTRINRAKVWNSSLVILQVEKDGRDILEKLKDHPELQKYPLVCAISPDVDWDDNALILWGLFTRFDCYRDTFFASTVLKRSYPTHAGPLFIDATWKPGYPEPLSMTEEIIQKVDQRWKDYGISTDKPPRSPNRVANSPKIEPTDKKEELTHAH